MKSTKFKEPINQYLFQGVAKYQFYSRECLNVNPLCSIEYSGRQDGIHILTKNVAAGDEIGWDFVTSVNSASVSITGYVRVVNGRYPCENGPKFMSRQTFVKWIFSWISNFKEDFRTTCSFCNSNPHVLACDGTKIGMFFRNCFTSPIETPTTLIEKQCLLKRTNRQFFSYSTTDKSELKKEKRDAMEDLSFFIAKGSHTLNEWHAKSKDKTGSRSESDRLENLLKHTPLECRPVIMKFSSEGFPPEVNVSLCSIFEVLSTSCPLSSLINWRFLGDLEVIFQNFEATGVFHVPLDIRQQLPEIYRLLHASQLHNCLIDIICFIRYIAKRVSDAYATDDSNDLDSELLENNVKEAYNPELSGKAYYFTKSGGRIRDIPVYKLNEEKEVNLYRKNYVQVAKSGMTYLFLWFDPKHIKRKGDYHATAIT